MAVTTAAEFWGLLDKSGILSTSQSERARQVAGEESDLKQLARVLIKAGLLTTWQARQLLSGVAGLRLGKYKLLEELGRSELGRVYLAEHTQLVRRAALKLLARELSDNKESLQQFLVEARAIAVLDHPHVVHTLDVASEGDRYYVVFEFVDGKDLARFVQESGALSPARAVELVRQAADGLTHAHEHGVVHADLKPSNLLVDAQGNLKILDLGVARLSSSLRSEGQAGAGGAASNHLFRAPELLQTPSAVTPQVDLYSLGVILFYLLSGQLPAAPDSESEQSATDALLTQLAVVCPDLPDDLMSLCGKLLAQSPLERVASAAELRDALGAWLALHPAATPPKGGSKEGADATAAAAGRSPSPAAKPASGGERPAVPARRGPALPRTPAAKVAPLKTAPKSDPNPATNPGNVSSSSFDLALDAQVASDAVANSESDAVVSTAAVDDLNPSPLVFKPSPKRPGAKPSRGAPKSKSGDAASGGGGASKADGSAAVPAKMGAIPLWGWIVGGAGVGGVLLVVVIVVLVLAFQRGPGPEVAKGTTAPTAAVPVNGSTPQEGLAVPAAANNEGPGESASAPDATAVVGSPAPAEPTATPTPESTPAKPDEKTIATGEPKPVPVPVVPPNDQPPSVPAAKPEPEPKPAPAPPPPPAPKPAPAPLEPFKDFAPQFVELPPLGKESPAADPVSLGKVHIGPKSLLIVHLLGGDSAIKGKFLFALEAAEGGTAERDWEVFLREGEAETGGTKIGHLALKDADLTFRWEAAATELPAAPHLMNCMLQMAAGPKQLVVALRKPLEVEALKAEILKGPFKGKWDIPYPPNSDKVKVEMVFEGPWPPSKFEGQMPMDGDKGKAVVWFGASQEDQVLAFRLETVMRKQLELGFDPHFRLGTTGKPEKLNANVLARTQKAVMSAQQTAFGMSEFGKKKAGGKNDEATQQQLALLESNLANVTKAAQQLGALKLLGESLVAEGKIHVRVFCQVDDKTVDLVRSANMPVAPGKKGP